MLGGCYLEMFVFYSLSSCLRNVHRNIRYIRTTLHAATSQTQDGIGV